MKREIKFRAWDGLRITTSGIMYNNSLGTLETPKISSFKIMQFTGLKDKNGIDIYELDYVLDEFNQRILVEFDFTLLSILKKIQNKIVLDGNFYE